MIVVGIDPGVNGAVACIGEDRALLSVWDIPTYVRLVGGRPRKYVDSLNLRLLVDWLEPDVVGVEKVGSRPGQGVVSVFGFGQTFGRIEGALCHHNVQMVTPGVWKKAAGISSDKKEALELARNVWPEWRSEFARVKDADRAEAALIAEFFWMNEGR